MTERSVRRQRFQYVERELTSLLASLAHRLAAEDAAQVREYIGVAEYGLALETICGSIEESNIHVPRELYPRIAELGQKMGMEAEVWERIRPLTEG